uniref:BZIP domain-containing protein n=1 Tax=Setaria digitata TaxID=48799 RepID=A0A915Q550_9BILA
MQLYCNVINSPRGAHPSSGIPDSRQQLERRELRRIRNNDAARRSRQARRVKEAKNHARLAALERENYTLLMQINALKRELEHVHLVLSNISVIKADDNASSITNCIGHRMFYGIHLLVATVAQFNTSGVRTDRQTDRHTHTWLKSRKFESLLRNIPL